jgi:alanine racemase
MYTLQEIAEITQSRFSGTHNNLVTHFLNDSRNLQAPADTLFIALKSKRNNGHQYIEPLIRSGVRSFLILKGEIDPAQFPEASFLIAADPLSAIQMLAAFHRKKFRIPVIGITGSNGKTVVKEWLYQSLKSRFTICRSPKSYNSQIGVPLSVLNLSEEHSLAIFEAGLSRPSEMSPLAAMIRPTLGIFTGLGAAHDEGFKSREEKVREKFLLFDSCEKIIINGLTTEQVPKDYLKKCIFAGTAMPASLSLPFNDEASRQNSLTCAAVLKEFGFSENEISTVLAGLQPVALRLEIKNGINSSLLINDYYNSDFDSLKIALSYLHQQSRRSKKILVISDIEQSGVSPSILYRQLGELFSESKIDLLIGIGKEIGRHRSFFKSNSLFFEDTRDFKSKFSTFDYQLHNATVLLKGARSFGFESIGRMLQQKSHDTVFEINLNRLTDNVNYYRSLLDENVQLMCMVKAMGYGSGSSEIARTLEHIGVNYLAVAYADEGVELRNSLVKLPVMVMNPEEEAFDDIINFNLEPEIYSFKVLASFIRKLDAFGITDPYPIHIKIDTGMRRLGFEEEELTQLITALEQNTNVRVKSFFSHLAGSDNPALDDFTKEQIRIFEKTAAQLEAALGYTVIKHICNSGAITRFKSAHYNMVRLGIGLYGIGVNEAEQKNLSNVGVLKTRISQIKKVRRNETIGYNRNGKAEQDILIAIIPIGYADGFSRLLGNGKHGVYIHGTFCRTIGNICMDMCMIDITSGTCSEGDEVIVFENTEQINALAKALNTISYEVLTNVSGRVKRVYVQE